MLFLQNLVGSLESAEIDRLAEKKYGLSSEILMESAGRSTANYISRYFSSQIQPPQEVMILCGPGNNGGDGLVLARHLFSQGVRVCVFVGDSKKPLVTKQKDRLKLQNIPIYSLNLNRIKRKLKEVSIVIDALFGVGLNRPVGGIYRDIIECGNSGYREKPHRHVLRVALDVPSGLDVNTGWPVGAFLKQKKLLKQKIKKQNFLPVMQVDMTLTYSWSKPGFYLCLGPTCAGRILIVPIGLSNFLLKEIRVKKPIEKKLIGKSKSSKKYLNTSFGGYFLITRQWVSFVLPQREAMDHKACHGHLLVLAGSSGMWGAGQLCAMSAYRIGCGYVTLASEQMFYKQKKMREKRPIMSDVLTGDIEDKNLLNGKTAVVIGPGLKEGRLTKNLLDSLIKQNQTSLLQVVIDAGAFGVLVREGLYPLPSHWIVTPHSGELGRLFGISGREIDRDRCGYATKASQILGCIVLLKGFHSVLAWSSKGKTPICALIPTGNVALAKAGTGDVLSGLIGALLARLTISKIKQHNKEFDKKNQQIKTAWQAVAIGAFIHGECADEWLRLGKDRDSLTASDLNQLLPFVLKTFR